jgi:hypothetical protein
MKIVRYNPNKDKAGLIELAESYAQMSDTPFVKENFIKEIDER